MAIPALHFSGVYKEDILNKNKVASIIYEEYSFPEGENILIYISETPNMFDDNPNEKRFGNAKITESVSLELTKISDEMAVKCGYNNSDEVISAMREWFPGIKDDQAVTYVEFETLF